MNDRSLLKVFGVLFCLLAISNFMKPLEYEHQGFVFFGLRQHGTPNLILGPLFGLYLLVYGIAVLRMTKVALPMSRLYAAYVIINLALFTVRMSGEALAKPIFGLVYIAVAVGVSSGAAYLLSKHRDELT
jgi:hypothetical protein